MSHSYRLVGALALVAASLLATAPPAAAANATNINFTLPAVTRTTYSISGTVLNNATSAGVAQVSVYASHPGGGGSFTSGWATTIANGYYKIDHLLPGSYTLSFGPPSGINLQHGYRNATAPTYFSPSTPVAVTIVSASLTGRNIRLPTGFTIKGTVTRSDGTTVPGVDVTAMNTNGSWGDDTVTSSNGNYMLMGLSPGSYRVHFGYNWGTINNPQTGCWYATPASKFSASCLSWTPVVIGPNATGISPKIPKGLTITGYVKTRASTPAPIVGALVVANGPEFEWTQTDANGRYTITSLNPGSYKIEVDGPGNPGSLVPNGYYNVTAPYYWARLAASASSVSISAWTTTLPIIKPPTGYYIKGKITNTLNSPLAGVWVTAVDPANGLTADPIAVTDASGNYAIGPVPAGNMYKIYADASSPFPTLQKGWYLNGGSNHFTPVESSASQILVTGDMLGNNMRLPVGASISGTVTITGGVCGGCSVEAHDFITGAVVASTSTSGTGTYMLRGLPAGSYSVGAFASDAVLNATQVRIITDGWYRSGVTGNFWPTQNLATPITVS